MDVAFLSGGFELIMFESADICEYQPFSEIPSTSRFITILAVYVYGRIAWFGKLSFI